MPDESSGPTLSLPLRSNFSIASIVLIYMSILIALGGLNLLLLEANNIYTEKEKMTYVDAAFTVVSAITSTGLTSFPLQDLNPYGYIVIVLSMIFGR